MTSFFTYTGLLSGLPMEQDSFTAHIHLPKLHSIVEVVTLSLTCQSARVNLFLHKSE